MRKEAVASTIQPMPTTTASVAFCKARFAFSHRDGARGLELVNGIMIKWCAPRRIKLDGSSAASAVLTCLVRIQSQRRTPKKKQSFQRGPPTPLINSKPHSPSKRRRNKASFSKATRRAKEKKNGINSQSDA